MSARTIYSYGYRNRSPDELVAVAEQFDATVVDCRYQPYSRHRQWGRDMLQKRLGWRYVWVRAFGNLKYREPYRPSADNVVLADPEKGLREVAPILAVRSIICLCMCDHHDRCHRRDVIDLMVAKFGLSVVLLGADAEPVEGTSQIPLL